MTLIVNPRAAVGCFAKSRQEMSRRDTRMRVFSIRYLVPLWECVGISLALRPQPGKNAEMSLYEDKAWYVVYSGSHDERTVQFNLRSKGLEVFFPRLLLPTSLHRRSQIVPFFPNYLFVRIRLPDEYDCLTSSSAVKGLVSFNNAPATLDDAVVAYLMRQANPAGVITGGSNLKVGHEIRTSGGLFDGIAGIIQDPPDARGRVRILIELLSRPGKLGTPPEVCKKRGRGSPINSWERVPLRSSTLRSC
jgi:transcription antitermination factor NusG